MKKLIMCGGLLLATLSLHAIDCLRSFQIDMEDAYIQASSQFDRCQDNQVTIGKCFRETSTALNHNIGTAADDYDDCMNRNGEPLP